MLEMKESVVGEDSTNDAPTIRVQEDLHAQCGGNYGVKVKYSNLNISLP
jgi:hypothetical protein